MKRSRMLISSFLTVASRSPNSILILSRIDSFFSRILATSVPVASSRTQVSRSRATFPLTLNALVPFSSSIQ